LKERHWIKATFTHQAIDALAEDQRANRKQQLGVAAVVSG